MQDFFRDEKIKLYRKALASCTAEDQRRVLMVLLRLLAAEQAELIRHSAKRRMRSTNMTIA